MRQKNGLAGVSHTRSQSHGTRPTSTRIPPHKPPVDSILSDIFIYKQPGKKERGVDAESQSKATQQAKKQVTWASFSSQCNNAQSHDFYSPLPLTNTHTLTVSCPLTPNERRRHAPFLKSNTSSSSSSTRLDSNVCLLLVPPPYGRQRPPRSPPDPRCLPLLLRVHGSSGGVFQLAGGEGAVCGGGHGGEA